MSATQSLAVSILERLVSFDTTSDKSNLSLIDYVQTYLNDHGISSTLIPSDDGEKASLFATVGPQNRGGIGLSGHTDVVPVDASAWSNDPYTLTHKNDRLFGRGTTDMKGYLACAMAMVPEFKKRPLNAPVHLLFSYDEETGCTGVRPMIAQLGESLPMPQAVFVGEPTKMTVVDAHKGPIRWRADITGLAAHASMAPLGVNAITYAGKLLTELAAIEQELASATPDQRFDPAYPTLQVTEISGGIAGNIVPPNCTIGFEMRALPGVDINAIEQRIRAFAEKECVAEMQERSPDASITISQTASVPPYKANTNSDAVALALKLTQQNETFAVSYATEAGLFQDGGAPTVVCGPGDIAQAHITDEWIEVSQIEACLGFMHRLADWAEN